MWKSLKGSLTFLSLLAIAITELHFLITYYNLFPRTILHVKQPELVLFLPHTQPWFLFPWTLNSIFRIMQWKTKEQSNCKQWNCKTEQSLSQNVGCRLQGWEGCGLMLFSVSCNCFRSLILWHLVLRMIC